MLGLGLSLTNFGTKGGVVDTPDLSGSSAAALLAAYGGEGFSMIFDSAAPSLKITDSTTPSNDWDSDLGDGYSVQDFFKTRSFTSYTGPVSTGKRLMQADGYIKPCRHNLLPMSNRFGSGAWTRTAVTSTYGQTDADGGSTASLITESNTATSVLYTTTAFTTAANVPYTISVKIKKGNSTWVRLAFGTSGGTFTNGVQQWYNLDTVATGTAATTGTASYISSSITATTNSYYILTLTASQASTTGALIVSTATADASATRTTSGTYYICHAMCNAGSQAIDYVSSEAHNICLQSQTFQTTWTRGGLLAFGSGSTVDATTSPDGTATADLQTEDTSTGDHRTYQSISVISGLIYTFSCYLKPNGRTLVTLYNNAGISIDCTFNISSGTVTNQVAGTASIESVGNGWYRCSVVNTASSTATGNYQIRLVSTGTTTSYTGDGVSGVYMWGAQVELSSSPGKYVATTAAAVYNPHFDLPVEYNTDGTVKALVREEARTNLALYSNDLTNAAWTKSNMSTAMTATGADGASSSATTCTATAANATVLQAITSASSARITSAYIKRRTGSGNIDMTQDNGSTWTTVSVTSSWTRLNIASVTSTNPTVGLRIVTSGDEIDVMYFQHEAAATISSPIVTGSAAVTRANDFIYCATTIFPFDAAEGGVYMSLGYGYRGLANTPIELGESGLSSRLVAMYMNNSTNPYMFSTTVNSSLGTITAGSPFKFAIGYKVNDFAGSLDGAAVVADTSASIPTGINRLSIGTNAAGTEGWINEIREVMYVPGRPSDASLVTLSTP